MEITTEEKIRKMLPFLNEKQQRLYCALEAEAIGFGGVTKVSKASKKSRPTIYLGKAELRKRFKESESTRVRKKGGGRKKIYEKHPQLLTELEMIVAPETRGNPMSPLKWTCKSTRQLAETLKEKSFQTSHVSVAEMLKVLGYSLQSNSKTIEGGDHPDRDRQFQHINAQSKRYMAKNQPVISVDTKKKELIGNYKNAGRDWEKSGTPIAVNVYDFEDKTLGKAVPYGIYDIAKNEGFVNVGRSFDTSVFAVSSIRNWWLMMGLSSYPKAKKLLITADGGGSNESRRKLWKTELQKFCNEYNLEVTVCHFPPGTSKWNKIEHRLFSYISMNWKGKPLTTFETVVSLIGATTTKKGLKVRSVLDENEYKKGIEVENKDLENVNIHRRKFHGDWNYTIKPN